MFLDIVKREWQKGNASIGISSDGSADKVWVEAKGLTGILVSFLTESEKKKLARLESTSLS